MRSQSSDARAVASAPAMTSEWPLRYFEAECITISAPSRSGCVNTGVAQVRIDCQHSAGRMRDLGKRRDVADRPERIAGSFDVEERSCGLERGAHRIEIRGVDELDRIAEAFPSLISQRRNAQYMTCEATMRDPGGTARMTLVAAAMPEPNTSASLAPSSAAITASVWRTVALSGRP